MHLKSLTLRGFKSFASATTLRFEPGITCVVGPNGSGKSNVVDALSWVMGEQGAKSLRGGKMEDVIFAGTTGRPPLGRAEVSLTIDNSDGALPIDYAEVTITRIMFRGGSSEYQINGDTCRLLDIQELLSDSGIGREMHVIVGQGQLDSVLHADPMGRRAFIEEASGVLKHRKRKEKALRKLDAMQANLSRVQDLTEELRRQLKPLGRQAAVARRAAVIQADLRDARLRLLADDLVALRAALEAELADEAALKGRKDAAEAQLADAVRREAELEEAVRGLAPRLQRAQQTWYELSQLAERVRGTASLADARVRSASAPQEEERRGRDPEDMEREAARIREQEAELAAALEAASRALEDTSAHRAELERALAEEERRLRDAARAIADRREGLARLTGRLGAARSRAGAAQAEADRLAAARDAARQRAQAAQEEYEALAEEVGGLEEPSADGEHEAAKAELAQAEAALAAARDAATAAERSRAAVAARRDALALGLRRKDGTGAALAARDRLAGLLGPAAERLTVAPGCEAAVAAALGAAADALAADSPAAAARAIRHLRDTDAGRAAFLITTPPASRRTPDPAAPAAGPADPTAVPGGRRAGLASPSDGAAAAPAAPGGSGEGPIVPGGRDGAAFSALDGTPAASVLPGAPGRPADQAVVPGGRQAGSSSASGGAPAAPGAPGTPGGSAGQAVVPGGRQAGFSSASGGAPAAPGAPGTPGGPAGQAVPGGRQGGDAGAAEGAAAAAAATGATALPPASGVADGGPAAAAAVECLTVPGGRVSAAAACGDAPAAPGVPVGPAAGASAAPAVPGGRHLTAAPPDGPQAEPSAAAEGEQARPDVLLGVPAAGLVRGDADLVRAVARVLRDHYLVADLGEAEALVAARPEAVAVTRDGDVLAAHLAHGGSAGAPSLIEVQAAVDEAAAELDRLDGRCRELAAAQEAAGEHRRACAARVEELGERRRAAEQARAGTAQQLGRLAGQAKGACGEAERSAAAAEKARAALEEALAEAEECAERLAAAEESHGEAEEEPDTAVRDRLAADGANARQTEMEARLQLRTHEERVKALAGRADALDRGARAEREARARAAARRERLRREAEVARAVADGARQLLAHVEVSLGRAREERAAAEEAKAVRERELGEARTRGRDLKAELDKLTDSVHRGEVLGAEKRLRIEQVEGRALEEFGMGADALLAEYGPDQPVPPSPPADGEALPEDPEHPRNRPGRFVRAEQEKRLKAAERAYQQLGKVNPLALEEFAALEERHKFLSEQLEDLRRTRADLLQVVKEVDRRVEQVFTEAYHDTAREFEGVFSRLFPGGEGRLVLTDPDDMLATGVDVEARPPGKKVKRLSLLSGGERSLTAVALLVSIFKARPSPFYVMDEVEAALDDTNLQRLIRIMEELQESSQLIVITHQKRTMEVADALYGVSMQGDGVSKVISQRLR
ncbi:chromosome segregation protein SMC [Streptomyces sp. WAC05292]|uniref:chromosome segregation SMC family protein n=1 Tax=Streptomyces sp. WAC05292 TaxID=2487418 RepID=UPI000F739B58|nr:AAA family ATPase [Streptomyces sp. WAC05292]RSS86159.1 chromosome segregation protein SMC [Streptomyces sp. WAC05292]